MDARKFHISLKSSNNAIEVTVELEADNCRKCGNNAVEFFDSNGGHVACMTFRSDVEQVVDKPVASSRKEYELEDRRLEFEL
jgi:hypothetical protein